EARDSIHPSSPAGGFFSPTLPTPRDSSIVPALGSNLGPGPGHGHIPGHGSGGGGGGHSVVSPPSSSSSPHLNHHQQHGLPVPLRIPLTIPSLSSAVGPSCSS
ncbi:unnamed protein product, partial [Discosporangium mesarthrocarpum]